MRFSLTFPKVFFVSLFLAISGCSYLTPYSSDFQCPDVDKGKCVSVNEAYKMSLNGKGQGEKDKDNKKGNKKEDAASGYKAALQEKLTDLIKNPVTPVVVPPKALRVLMFPYANKSELYMPRYIYILVDDPRWVVGDYLIDKERK